MNRIIYFMMCAIAICSCTKEAETTQAIAEGEPMQFTAGSISKADIKSTWEGDGTELVAITRGGDGTKIYKVVDANGTLEPNDEEDYWGLSFSSQYYVANYPSTSVTTTAFSDEDILYSEITTTDSAVNFQFEHMYAILKLTFTNSTGLALSDCVLEAIYNSTTTKTFENVSLTDGVEFFIRERTYNTSDTNTLTLTLKANGYVFPITLDNYTIVGGNTYNQPVTLTVE